jgi:predicted outer membrane repeat protein
MTKNLLIKKFTICALIMVVGLFLALLLPWLADIQGLASSTETSIPANNPGAVTRYYVSKTGNGENPTLGWSTAYTSVQDALALAAVFGGEIWVAAGVYYPDQGIGQLDDSKSSTFVLAENVKMYGGFDTNDTTFSERDWEANLTVLSGDIDENDTDTEGVVLTTTHIKGKNSYHVVRASGVTSNTVLDGFTITGGQANSGDTDYLNSRGGGFDCEGSGDGNECSPILKNLSFSGNYAVDDGGAMFSSGSSGGNSIPSLVNVTFIGNSAGVHGGAIYSQAINGTSNPSLIEVTFFDNSAVKGGAVYNFGFNGASSPNLRDVNFSENSAVYGGAMYSLGNQGDSNPILVNVAFSGNSADTWGGAMVNEGRDSGYSSPSLKNVVFSGNSALNGGAIYNFVSSGTSFPILSNVTFSGNSAGKDGGAMYNDGSSGGLSSALVRNSILWNNKDISGIGTITAAIYNASTTTKLINSIVQGSFPGNSWIGGSYDNGGGNIDEDPKFIAPVDPATAPTTNGNLRLQSNSPAIDVGDNTFVSGVTTDLAGEPRIVDGDEDGTLTVDMGAYEYIEYRYDGYLPVIIH